MLRCLLTVYSELSERRLTHLLCSDGMMRETVTICSPQSSKDHLLEQRFDVQTGCRLVRQAAASAWLFV